MKIRTRSSERCLNEAWKTTESKGNYVKQRVKNRKDLETLLNTQYGKFSKRNKAVMAEAEYRER